LGLLHRHRGLTPYLLLAPGLLWLTIFFVVPLGFLAYQSLQSGNVDFGYAFTWSWGNYWSAIRDYRPQFVRSLEYAGIATAMALPVYVSLEQVDPRLIEAAEDLYANKIRAFLRVTLPLSLPGVVAGTLLTFIPAAGDFINAQLLGGPENHMIGNVIQSKFLAASDYPSAAAMSFILMGGIIAFVAIYARIVGTEQLTGTAT